jgi:TRAP-type C4-dicarboxylate transport system permease small subunit
MSENLSVSNFSFKKSYMLVAVGLILLAAGTLFAYSANQHLEAGVLPPEELARQGGIYAAAKIISMIGFIIALIPSVRILQNALLNEKAKSSGTKNCKDNKNEKNNKSDVDSETEDDKKDG